MKILPSILFSLFTAAGCAGFHYECLTGDQPAAGDGFTELTLYVRFPENTRSSISPSETSVENINFYAYRDGVLESEVYGEDLSAISARLVQGCEYELYAVANVGKVSAPASADDLGELCCSIKSTSDIGRLLPMAWCLKSFRTSHQSMSLDIRLERLTSKISFAIDKTALQGMRVTSVRLCRSALNVRPFSSGGSRAVAGSEVADGDYASGSDLAEVNSGGRIFFFCLENCQGTLLPENEEPWGKVPDAIGEKALLCTYIEVDCVFDEGSLFEGNVKYRFYPGDDNVTNFDIRRNTEMCVTLFLTGKGLKEISWRVDADITVNDGYAGGYIEEGRHGLDNLYVGERFRYAVDLDKALYDYIGGDIAECTLGFESQDGGSIVFDRPCNIHSSNIVSASGTCRSAGSGEIWLLSHEGEKICRVSGRAVVKKPGIVLSFSPDAGPSEVVEEIRNCPECRINGEPESLYLYLVDDAGYNLNTDCPCGFDLTPFSFEKNPYWESEFKIDDNFSIEVEDGMPASDGPAVTYVLKAVNDGTDVEANRELAECVRVREAIRFDIDEINHLSGLTCSASLAFHPVGLTLVDNGWAGYHSSQISLKVDNRSNMPLDISVWQVDTHDDDWNAVGYDGIVSKVERDYRVRRPAYVTDVHYDGDRTLYGNCSRIRCERNAVGDPFAEDGEYMVYPLENIETEVIANTICYDRRGQHSLHHLVDVSMGGTGLGHGEISVVDMLSDGSPKYDIIYGDDPQFGGGWNDCGIWLWSGAVMLCKPDLSLDSYDNVSAAALDNLMTRFTNYGSMNLELRYDVPTGHLYARCPKGDIFGITLEASVVAEAEGYVRTYPDGTMFAGKDNYCTASSARIKGGLSIGSSEVAIDGGAIRECMDKIYNTTFFDSKNKIGAANSYQHSAHPVRVDVTLSLRTTGSGGELYPVSAVWKNETLEFHHPQDGTAYFPVFGKTFSTFGFVRTERKL